VALGNEVVGKGASVAAATITLHSVTKSEDSQFSVLELYNMSSWQLGKINEHISSHLSVHYYAARYSLGTIDFKSIHAVYISMAFVYG
jgi:hypothetical protein